jgi:hypothetical protein
LMASRCARRWRSSRRSVTRPNPCIVAEASVVMFGLYVRGPLALPSTQITLMATRMLMAVLTRRRFHDLSDSYGVFGSVSGKLMNERRECVSAHQSINRH